MLRGSNARPARWGSALTATPGHPLLFRIKLPLPLASTLPFSKQSLDPFRERIVLDSSAMLRGSRTIQNPRRHRRPRYQNR